MITLPVVTLIAPNGGEVLRGGGTYTITWTATDIHFGTTPIALAYSTDGGTTFSNTITTATENDGSYVWTVPGTESTNVQIQVAATDLAGNSDTDASDANFSLDNTAPTVALTAPNGGELLRGGGTFTITWTASDAHFGAQPIALHYSTDGCATFPYTITTATENDGSYVWSVPALESTTVRVRVTAT
ncbi:MAG: hypothetical protein GYA43_08875, partial [Bacteroidales bacterium]|nr:hypothetical protein [Bacteroidales bacterium]